MKLNWQNETEALYTFLFQNAPNQEPVYRKVAIVENFFDIIYTVHVELEGRPGKHAGQKRTYRTVSYRLHVAYALNNMCNVFYRT